MKQVLFLAIGLLFAGAVSAQGYYGGRGGGYAYDDFYQPKIGFEVGANISNTVTSFNSNFQGTAAIAGFNAGITFDLPIVYPLSFAPEVLYSQKGYAAVTNAGNFTQHTNYIDVPLLLKFNVGPVFNFYAGPQISFLTSTENTYDNGFMVTSEQYYNQSGNKNVVTGVVGVSFDLSRNVDLHARYCYDLQPTNTDGNTYVTPYRNQVWQFGLGIKFF